MARGRTRTIKPGFFTNKKIRALPPRAQLLFIYLFTQADGNGILEDKPGEIWRGMTGRTDSEQGERMLGLLEAAGLVQRYEAEGHRLIAVVGWYEHQPPGRGERAKWPQPPGRSEPESRRGDGRTNKFIDYAFESHLKVFGVKMPVVGGRDAKAIKPLLQQYSLEKLQGWWDEYLRDTEPFINRQGRDIAKFISHVARYVTRGRAQKICLRCGGEGILRARNGEQCPECGGTGQAGGLNPGMREASRPSER